MDAIQKEITSKLKVVENQQADDRKHALERENLFTFKTDTINIQAQLTRLDNRMNEYSTEYDDTISDFKMRMIEFSKKVTDMAKNISNMNKEHEDLSNAAKIVAAAEELLNK